MGGFAIQTDQKVTSRGCKEGGKAERLVMRIEVYTINTTNTINIMSTINTKRLSADWICGFVDGEGTFLVSIERQPKALLGEQAWLGFKIAQGRKCVQTLYKIKEFFGIGVVKPQRGDDSVWEYRVSNFKHICDQIVPFFEKHPLHTMKRHDLLRLRHAKIIMERKEHLTSEGLAKLRRIRSKINLPTV